MSPRFLPGSLPWRLRGSAEGAEAKLPGDTVKSRAGNGESPGAKQVEKSGHSVCRRKERHLPAGCHLPGFPEDGQVVLCLASDCHPSPRLVPPGTPMGGPPSPQGFAYYPLTTEGITPRQSVCSRKPGTACLRKMELLFLSLKSNPEVGSRVGVCGLLSPPGGS